jgi:hypothetical protein
MKAEHRKELQTNFLADRLGKWLQAVKTGPKPSSTSLVGWVFVLVAVGLIVGWVWYSRQAREDRSQLWLALDQDFDLPSKLETLSQKNQGTEPALIARFQVARLKLREGLKELYTRSADGRTEAADKVKEAAELYEQLAREAQDTPVLVQEALLGAATARESLGEVPQAVALYTQLQESYRKSPLGEATPGYQELTAYIEKLNKGEKDVEAFYKEMQKVAAASAPPPLGGTP